jgi:S-(hydroxymethyl)glutathione dehydrogenase/alcohol dehydrogenase
LRELADKQREETDMKAAVLRELGRLEIENVDLDGPNDDEVRVRVTASGLCHSDLHMITGDLAGIPRPSVLGHEAAGVVEKVGKNVVGLKKGDLVTTCISAYCGGCRECQRGFTHICDTKPGDPTDRPKRTRITKGDEAIYTLGNLGGFAEEMCVHHRNVVKVPDQLPAHAAALMGCAVLTGVGAAIHGAKVQPGETVAVIGCGGVGLSVIQGARIAGASRIIAVDLKPSKLELAQKLGATDVVTGGPDAVGKVVEMTGGGVDYAFEVIGLPSTIRDAFMMLRKRGAAVLIGIAPTGAEVSLPVLPFIWKETRVISSIMGSAPFQLFLPQLAGYYLSGQLNLDSMVSHKIKLDEINEGYDRMKKGDAARNVIVF